MSDVHPYPHDISADPFFVFGGLFSRKVVASELALLSASKPTFLSKILELSGQCAREEAFQRGIETVLNESGFVCSRVPGKMYDRVIVDRFIIEVKLDNKRFDPQFWNGSESGENAVVQTRGYLDNTNDYQWALLTNGKIWRIMNKASDLNYVDFWMCDAEKSGNTVQATMFQKILSDPNYLSELKEKSDLERKRFNSTFGKCVQDFWNTFERKGNRDWNVSLVEAVLCIAFQRYLEDCGILPVLSASYEPYSLKVPRTAEEVIKCLRMLKSQKFLVDNPTPEIRGIIDEPTLNRIASLLSNPRIMSKLKKLFWDERGAIDLSDLSVAFFGDAYQVFANKTDINGVDGQYFTGSELAKETALYFVEEESRGVHADEVIYDPFVGSGQLLRALVPFFHLLIQGESRDPSIISGMRTLATRLSGTDVDPNACWLARLSLTIATSAKGMPLLDFTSQIRHADVFETCFGFTESRWQAELGIVGKIRGIITNPPWRRLRQTANELYTIETGNQAPLRSNRENWNLYQTWLGDGGRARAEQMGNDLSTLSAKHKETFVRSEQREVNVAISAADFVDRLPGVSNKRWVMFLPDCFFVGQNGLRTSRNFSIRRYYSFPFNDHFEGTDDVMKFGVVFGGGAGGRRNIQCRPMGIGTVDVSNVFRRLGILPIYENEAEAIAQTLWFGNIQEDVPDWHRGEFDENMAPAGGARSVREGGVPVRGAKKCNDNISHSCIVNPDSISNWANWSSAVRGFRVIVRDNRSNTRRGKVLWSGVHLPGQDGVPRDCALSNAWNYLLLPRDHAIALSKILNTPLADLAIRSIASKRHINPKDLRNLGTPALTPEQIQLMVAMPTFEKWTAAAFVSVFRLSARDAGRVLDSCGWVKPQEKREILRLMTVNPQDAALELQGMKITRRRGQVERAALQAGVRLRRR